MGNFLKGITALVIVLFTSTVFAAGSVSVSRSVRSLDGSPSVRVISLAVTADAADGTVPNTSLTKVHGCLMKVIVNPGATAPTDNYDIEILDADDSTADAANALLLNRDTANTEVVRPLSEAGGPPLYFQPGTYTFKISNNSVNSALIVVKMFFVDCAP